MNVSPLEIGTPFRPAAAPLLLCASAAMLLAGTPTEATASQPRMLRDLYPGSAPNSGLAPLRAARIGDRLILLGADHHDTYGWDFYTFDLSSQQLEPLPGPASVVSSDIGGPPYDGVGPFRAGDFAFLLGRGGDQRQRLWRSDGTAAGTFLLADQEVSVPRETRFRAFESGLAIFEALVSEETFLYVSDGTTAGTHAIVDEPANGDDFVEVEDGVLFSGTIGSASGLWLYDRQSRRPTLLHDSHSNPLGKVGDRYLFSAYAPGSGQELWSVGRDASTAALVRDIYPGPASSSIWPFGIFDSRLFFVATTPDDGRELWVSDATNQGTDLFFDRIPGPDSAFADMFSACGEVLLFATAAPPGKNQRWETWRTDGQNTYRLATWTEEEGNSQWICNDEADLYFHQAGSGTKKIWYSDGSPDSKTLIAEVPSYGYSFTPLLAEENRLLFGSSPSVPAAFDNELRELTHDGEQRQLTDVQAPYHSGPIDPKRVGDKVFFTGWSPLTGNGVGVSDGTPEGTRFVGTPDDGPTLRSNSTWLWPGAGGVFFEASPPQPGFWYTDGENENTVRVASEDPEIVVPIQDEIAFLLGGGLWFSNGTVDGPREVLSAADLEPGATREDLVALDDRLAFLVSRDQSPGLAPEHDLWFSDGSLAGTAVVFQSIAEARLARAGTNLLLVPEEAGVVRSLDVESLESIELPGPTGSPVNWVSDFDSTPLISYGPYEDRWYWETDGTIEGTLPLATSDFWLGKRPIRKVDGAWIAVDDQSLEIFSIWPAEGRVDRLDFAGDRPTTLSGFYGPVSRSKLFASNREALWEVDPAAGTVARRTGSELEALGPPVLAGDGSLVFTAFSLLHGQELYRTDARTGETTQLTDIRPGMEPSVISYTEALGDQILFPASDGVNGQELWAVRMGELFADGFESGDLSAWSAVR